VSTDEQAQSGAGLAAQRAAIEAEAERRSWVIVDWFTDVASGKEMKRRPQLAGALDAMRNGQASTLVVSKLDRLSRSVLDFATILANAQVHGWKLVTLDIGVDTSTPTGELLVGMLANFAQWERRLISQRTTDALAQKKIQGVRIGRPASVPTEIVERIHAARVDGQTLTAIAEALAADEVPTAHGGARWYASTVRAILARATR
jgi:DNA invertase Pin-like site-specific DNA recombinase